MDNSHKEAIRILGQSNNQIDPFAAEDALRTLANLAFLESGRDEIRKNNGVKVVVPYLSHENEVLVMLSALTLSNLVLDNELNAQEAVKHQVFDKISTILEQTKNADILQKIARLLINLTLHEFPVSDKLIKLMSEKLIYGNKEVAAQFTLPLRNIMINDQYQDTFVKANGLKNLIPLLRSEDQTTLENAVALAANVAAFSDEPRRQMIKEGYLSILADLLIVRSATLQQNASDALNNISLCDDVEDTFYKSGCVPRLVNLMNSDIEDVQISAVSAVSNLLGSESVAKSVLENRGEAIVYSILKNKNNEELLTISAQMVGNLAIYDRAREKLQKANIVTVLESLAGKLQDNPDAVDIIQVAIENVQEEVPELPLEEEELIEEISTVSISAKKLEPSASATTDLVETLEEVLEIPEPAPVKPLQKAPSMSVGKREAIAREIYETEKSYVSSLVKIEELWYLPLLEMIEAGKPLISQESLKTIFSDLRVIKDLHKVFLKDIEPHIRFFWNDNAILSTPFIKLSELLKLYSTYIKNYDEATETLTKCLKNTPFKNWFEQQIMIPESNMMDLFSLLIMPVQRVPRYVLLLSDLLKHTPEEHPDYANLQVALEKIRKIAEFLNEEKRKSENASKFMTISKSLTGANSLGQFIRPDRVYIDEGDFLVVKSSKKKASQYRHFFLFNDILIYSKKDKDKFKFKNNINLGDPFLRVTSLPDSPTVVNAFKLETEKTELVLCASSAKEKEKWLNSIRDAIAVLKQKATSREAAQATVRLQGLFK